MSDRCILQVEDNENEAFLLRKIFDRTGIGNPVRVVTDGQMAVDYLSGAGHFADREKHPLPVLVLLELNLPKKDGLQVLDWIRRQPALKNLVVILFTSSSHPEMVKRAYELGANSYVTKPFSLLETMEMAQALKAWWLGCNRFALPDDARPPAAAGRPVGSGPRVEFAGGA